MSDGEKVFLVTVIEEGHWMEGRIPLKDALEQLGGTITEDQLKHAVHSLPWSDQILSAVDDIEDLQTTVGRVEGRLRGTCGALDTLEEQLLQVDTETRKRLNALEEGLQRLKTDMVAVKNTQGAHIKNCYHDLHDHEERLEVVEEWVRTFTDLTNSKLDWQQEANRTLYDLEERIRGLEAISEADDKWTQLTDQQLEQLELDIDGLRKLSYKLAERIGKLEHNDSLFDDVFHTELNIYEERPRVLEAKLEHVEDPPATEPLIADPDGIVHIRSLILDLEAHSKCSWEVMTEDEVLKVARGEELKDE
jgi:TolA-binding protein